MRVSVLCASIVLAVASVSGSAPASPPVYPPGLWVGDIDGRPTERLARYTTHGAGAPDWSPDSSRVAYEGGHIFVVDVASGDRRRVTDEAAYDSDPDWSPDGTHIAFARSDGPGGRGIYVVDVATGEETSLTSGRDRDPDWSPDGSQIVFSRWGPRRGIFVVEVATPVERKLIGDDAYGPEWSPEGSWIAFATSDLYVVRPDGTGIRNLSRSPSRFSTTAFDWSPDGTRLVYARGGPSMFVVNLNGRGRKRLRPAAPGGVDYPSWMPNGRRIMFDNLERIFTIRPDGTRPRTITIGYSSAVSPDGSKVSFLRR